MPGTQRHGSLVPGPLRASRGAGCKPQPQPRRVEVAPPPPNRGGEVAHPLHTQAARSLHPTRTEGARSLPPPPHTGGKWSLPPPPHTGGKRSLPRLPNTDGRGRPRPCAGGSRRPGGCRLCAAASRRGARHFAPRRRPRGCCARFGSQAGSVYGTRGPRVGQTRRSTNTPFRRPRRDRAATSNRFRSGYRARAHWRAGWGGSRHRDGRPDQADVSPPPTRDSRCALTSLGDMTVAVT